jgi:hypothetical protein
MPLTPADEQAAKSLYFHGLAFLSDFKKHFASLQL